MDNLLVKRGEAFYFKALDQPLSGRAAVHSLGIRELMPTGFIGHGSPGDRTYLFMDFHSRTVVNPSDPAMQPETVEHGFILWQPGAKHHYGNAGAPWLHSWMNASGPAIDEAVAEHRLPLARVVDIDLSAITLRYLRALYDELQEHRVADDRILEGLIVLWIREIARAIGAKSQPPPRRLSDARRYIEGHFTEPLELVDLARRAALSVSQFSASFKMHFGVAPIQYAHGLRLRRAAQLLQDVALTVNEVAARVGYDDPLYFSRQFRKHMGQSPRHYRRARHW